MRTSTTHNRLLTSIKLSRQFNPR